MAREKKNKTIWMEKTFKVFIQNNGMKQINVLPKFKMKVSIKK
jgi:hypothetical protein